MENQKLISIVIPVYNGAGTITAAMQGVMKQYHSAPKEIIVVDDGSADQTAELVKKFNDVIYVHQINSGPASARNTGFRKSKGELVFFTDSDCIPQLDWIEKMLPHFQDPTIGVVAGSYGIANAKSRLADCIYREIIYRHHTRMPDFPKSFGSYNFCIRRNLMERLGGFNTSYRYASGEDNDLSYKVLDFGYKIYFERNSIVTHYFPEHFTKYLAEQYRHGFWRVKMYQDFPAMRRGDDYTFWKDAMEPMIVLMVLPAFVLDCLGIDFALWLPVIFLAVLELFFAYQITKSLPLTLFLSAVMFFRSFARTLGFLSGLYHFFPQKSSKKVK